MWLKVFVLILVCGLSFCAPEAFQETDYSQATLDFEPIHYDLDFSVDYDAEKLHAQCRMTLRNVSDLAVPTIPLILYRLLTITAITDDEGQPLEFEQKIVQFTDFGKKQVNFIQVTPSDPIPPQSQTSIKIEYNGYLLGYAETGSMYIKDHIDNTYTVLREDANAYPIVGVPNGRVNRARILHSYGYRISTTVPDHLVVANGGRLENVDRRDGRVTYTYTSLKPSWRIDVAIADYRIIEDQPNKLRAFFFAEDAEKGEMVLKTMQDTISLFTEWFGPLNDFLGFSVIEVPEGYGSQADAACILQTADTFHDRDSLTGLYHEISHIWNPSHLDPMPCRLESEGLAMLLQYLTQEKMGGKSDAVESGFNRLSGRVRQSFERNPAGKDVPIIAYGQEDLTDLSYSKGMLFFTLLYRLMGENEFLATVGSYQAKYRESGATTEEFIRYFQRNSSVELAPLFQEWVLGAESSRYIVEEWTLDEMLAKYQNDQ
jgi:aminopeptidase N